MSPPDPAGNTAAICLRDKLTKLRELGLISFEEKTPDRSQPSGGSTIRASGRKYALPSAA
jgi:hypothetical protein